MHSTKRIVIDLLSGNRPETIHVVQGDAYSRVVEIDLRQGKKPWAIPDGVSVAVEYIKPDGTKGLYDTLPDGTQAWNTEGNILTLMLAPQMLTANGTVVTQVRVMLGNTQLSLVKFSVYVHQKITGAESEDYINLNTFLPQVDGAKVGQYFKVAEVDDAGRATKVIAVDAPQGGVVDIPTKLPNPHALTITGAVNATYDGSEAVSVEIPDSSQNPNEGGLSATAAALLITILRNGVYSTDQSANITALENALASSGDTGGDTGGGETEKTLTSISATYSGGDVAVGTAVADLAGIVVVATYSDGSTATVTDYTLSGEIAEGENTITVTYDGKTATFAVTGVADSSGGDSEGETAVNLFDKDTMTVANKFINVTGNPVNNPGSFAAVIPVHPHTVYAIQFGTLDANFAAYIGSVALWDDAKSVIARAEAPNKEFIDNDRNGIGVTLDYDASGKGYTFTTTADTAFVAFTAKLNDNRNQLDTTMLEIGNVCHDYVAYVGGV